jgi:nitroreductase
MSSQILRLSSLVEKRYSPRAFQSTPLPAGTLEILLEAARRTPSSSNGQPWRFVYAEKASNPEAFAKMAETLLGTNKLWAPGAPLLLCGITQDETPEGKKIPMVQYDLGQAIAWLSAQATELGLYLHQIGGFNRDAARVALNIPAAYSPHVMVAVGFLGKPEQLSDDLRARELVRSTRKPLAEIAGDGTFPTL